MGPPGQHPSLLAMAVPDASTWGLIGSADTALVAGEVPRVPDIAPAPDALAEAFGMGFYGGIGQQAAHRIGVNSNDRSC